MIFEDTVSLHSLSYEEYQNNKQFYQDSFFEISESVGLDNVCEDWDDFFHRHPIYSVVYLKEYDKIVSFMYAAPHRDWPSCYPDKDLQNWGIIYIQTHKNFQKKRYASLLTLFGFEDMARNGAINVDILADDISINIFNRIIREYDLSIRDSDNKFISGVFTLIGINKICQLNKRLRK